MSKTWTIRVTGTPFGSHSRAAITMSTPAPVDEIQRSFGASFTISGGNRQAKKMSISRTYSGMVGSSGLYSLTSSSGASRAKISWYFGPSPLAINSFGKVCSSSG